MAREGRDHSWVTGVFMGRFRAATADLPITPRSVLIVTGDAEQFSRYDAAYGTSRSIDGSVVIIGGGRVGRAAGGRARAGGHRAHDHRTERSPGGGERRPLTGRWEVGDAAELDVLARAGLWEAASVLITPHDDDFNAYLTLFVRELCPQVQIISRANHDRNVSTLHRAGADSVLSYASLGATAI